MKLRDSHQALLAVLREIGPSTDAAVAEHLDMSGNTVRPRRRELADMGLVEKVGTVPTPGGREAAVWAAVAPERVEEVRQAAAARKPRRKSLHDQPLEWRLEAVRQLLSDPEVNAAVRNSSGRAWSRARGRARQTHERDRREVKEQLAQAERDNQALVNFLKAKGNLLRAMEMVRAIGRLADEEQDRRDTGRPTAIPGKAWPEVADLLGELDDVTEETLARIEEVFGPLGPDVIEAEAIEVEDFLELADGPGGGVPPG
jgi:predicted ArsR family transcriptional regulator